MSPRCREGLYSTITPVYSFRHVLNCELGLDHPLLEDVTYIGYDSFTPLAEAPPIMGIEPQVTSTSGRLGRKRRWARQRSVGIPNARVSDLP